MGQSLGLGSRKIIAAWAVRSLLFFALIGASSRGYADTPNDPAWMRSFRKRLVELEVLYPDQLGIYVKDLDSGEELSYRGEELWYVASGVKLPVALEVLRQIDQGKFSLDTRIRLRKSDYVDGAGETNRKKPGSLLSVRFLIEQMLIHSDNTASDLLIGKVGLRNVNRLVGEWSPEGFSPITKLAEVRRKLYGGFHLNASKLPDGAFLLLKAIPSETQRIRKLAQLMEVSPAQLKFSSLSSAYASYYSQNLNSATLSGYGHLLERVVEGRILKPASQRFLMETLTRVETGKRRIRAAIPPGFEFAHKTGTQYERICDFGVVWNPSPLAPKETSKRVLIAACSRNIKETKRAEGGLKLLGKALVESGVFQTPAG